MTSVMAWLAGDQRAPAAAYICSDSRISWSTPEPKPGANAKVVAHWDFGPKVFAATKWPELFGYAGDVVTCGTVLTRLVAAIDGGWLFGGSTTAEQRLGRVCAFLRASLDEYPHVGAGAPAVDVVYVTRTGELMGSSFHFYKISWRHGGKIDVAEPDRMPDRSGVVFMVGSGSSVVRDFDRTWTESEHGGTSRAAFAAFSDALDSGRDERTGGPPQLVGVYRKGPGRVFGVVHHGERYWMGSRVRASNKLEPPDSEWRNELFERVDWRTTAPVPGAAHHPRPKG